MTSSLQGQVGSDLDIYQQRFDANGNKVGSEVQVNTHTPNRQHESEAVALSDGGWVVTWLSNVQETVPGGTYAGYGVYQQRYDANGNKVGGEVQVNTTTIENQDDHAVAALKDGGWIVTWTCAWQKGVYQQRYDADGTKVGGETPIENTLLGPDDTSVTALSDGGWVVTFSAQNPITKDYDIYQQRFDKNGQVVPSATAPTGVSLTVSVNEGAPTASPAGSVAAVALDKSQGFTYTLLDDAGGRFSLSADGTLTVKDGIRLDYEQATSHLIKVQVQDKLTLATHEQWLQVAVADVASENLAGSAGADTLKGGQFSDLFQGLAGADQLFGGGGNDNLSGGLDADTVWGGLGNDKLYGGSGRDVFVFDTRTNKRSNVDKIYDFRSKDDSIWLDNAIFTKLGTGSASRPKKFKSDMFVEGKRAQDAEDRIVYDRKTGALYYDKDGTGGSAQVKIATITNKTKLYYHDLFVI